MRTICFLVAGVLAALALAGCPTPGPVNPGPDADAQSPPAPAPPVQLDAAPPPEPTPGDVCAAACMNLNAIGCPEANGFPGGRSCVETCLHDAPKPGQGQAFDMHPDCVARAENPTAVRKCGVACPTAPPPPKVKK